VSAQQAIQQAFFWLVFARLNNGASLPDTYMLTAEILCVVTLARHTTHRDLNIAHHLFALRDVLLYSSPSAH
jgi:hypothetical protein